MEELLRGYQDNLRQVNQEISVIEEQSLSLTHRLKNRREAEKLVAELLQGVIISPDLIRYMQLM